MDVNIFYENLNRGRHITIGHLDDVEECINRNYDDLCNVFNIHNREQTRCLYKGCLKQLSVDDMFASDICCAHHTIFEILYKPLLNLVLKGYTRELLIDILYNRGVFTTLEPTQSLEPYDSLPVYISGTYEPQQCAVCVDDTKTDLICLGCSVKHVMCYGCLCKLQTNQCPYCRAEIKSVFKYL